MASSLDFEALFKDGAFVASYRVGEKITGPFAKDLIQQSGILDSNQRPLVIFDNASGTGIVASTLHSMLSDDAKNSWELTCGDISDGMLEYARRRAVEEDWRNTELKIVDSQKTGLPDAHYSHVFAGFAFMAIPNHQAALDECFRTLKPGGTVALSTWQMPGWLSVVRPAIATLPGNLPFPTTKEFLKLNDGQWDSTDWVDSHLQKGGFHNVQVRLATRTIALEQEEFIAMISVMLPFVFKKFWTEEQREANEGLVNPALLRYLETEFGVGGLVSSEFVAVLATGRKGSLN